MESILRQRDFIAFCIKSTLIAAIPAIALGYAANLILSSIFAGAEWLYPKHTETNIYIDFLGYAIFAPLIETYILIRLLSVLKIYEGPKLHICIFAGIIFGIFHGLFGVLWFFAPCWGFMVFSYNYLSWEKINIKLAFWAACVPHILYNCIVLSI